MNNPPSADEEKRIADFLVKDYELKIRYLTDHFSRMWTRFNFFVGIESAIIGGKVIFGDGRLSTSVTILGALVALAWYVMGAEDRFLVDIYRKHVHAAGALVAQSAWRPGPPEYVHVGEVERSSAGVKPWFDAWRVEAISTTRLAAWIPLLVFVGWVAMLIARR